MENQPLPHITPNAIKLAFTQSVVSSPFISSLEALGRVTGAADYVLSHYEWEDGTPIRSLDYGHIASLNVLQSVHESLQLRRAVPFVQSLPYPRAEITYAVGQHMLKASEIDVDRRQFGPAYAMASYVCRGALQPEDKIIERYRLADADQAEALQLLRGTIARHGTVYAQIEEFRPAVEVPYYQSPIGPRAGAHRLFQNFCDDLTNINAELTELRL